MDIQAFPSSIETIFNGMDTRYFVPHYQRKYEWTIEHIAELWHDITTAADSTADYFLGSVVLNKEDQQDNQFQIVDGQQRLTTLTVLLAAIRDLAHHYQENAASEWFIAISAEGSRDDARVCEDVTTNRIIYTSDPGMYYLAVNDTDQPTLYERIQKAQRDIPSPSDDRSKIKPRDHRLIKAQKFFRSSIYEHFLKHADGFARLRAFLRYCQTKLKILKIVVASDVDAYLLFESLNDRGLELSIADLVKNRVLVACGEDANKRDRLLAKWNAMAEQLESSRFKMRDYLRFYWAAFHEACTAKQLYKKIRDALNSSNVQSHVDEWCQLLQYFCSITSKELRFPTSELPYPSLESCYAEMHQLAYAVHIPLFLKAQKTNPDWLAELAPCVRNFLFRAISIGDLSAGLADSKVRQAIGVIDSGGAIGDVLAIFNLDASVDDQAFMENLRQRQFEEPRIAKYLLAKIHLDRHGQSHHLGSDTELEHVLPQNRNAWPTFDCNGRSKEDFVYALGNLTLLEKKLNASVSDQPFNIKVNCYKQRRGRSDARTSTAIPMTFEIHQAFQSAADGTPERSWDAARIQQRTEKFAKEAVRIFSNEPTSHDACSGPPPRARRQRANGVRGKRTSRRRRRGSSS